MREGSEFAAANLLNSLPTHQFILLAVRDKGDEGGEIRREMSFTFSLLPELNSH
jgi:hypothetical protein